MTKPPPSSFIAETPALFESRKADHIRLALQPETQAIGGSGLERIRLRHEALPDLNFDEVTLTTQLFGRTVATPLFVSSMTAGHAGSSDLNLVMAKVSEKRNWPMGVGSQRKQLRDSAADAEWKTIRKTCSCVQLFGNIGLAQIIESKVDDVRRLVDTLQAAALFVHLNPLQECLQPEGTPHFKGGLRALENLTRSLGVPVVLKETGCGFSSSTLRRLRGIGLFAVDVSGFGGTHWGRIEGERSKPGELKAQVAESFRDWGIGTVESLQAAVSEKCSGGDYDVWASGGVRSGLDAAKLIAMGARHVGLAQPILKAAVSGEEALDQAMTVLEFELRTALFCTGAGSIETFREMKPWDMIKT